MTAESSQSEKRRLPRLYQLRVTVDKVQPILWRQIELEGDAPIDFVADAIRCAFGWSFTHAYKFVIKKRHYGTHNDWVRHDPEQIFKERRREIEKRKLGPRKTREALLALSDWYEETLESVDPDNEDAIPSLEELVPRVQTKFKFIFDFGDWWEHTVEVKEILPKQPGVDYPRCTDGAGADPLEDCGGWRVLTELIRASRNPDQPRSDSIQHMLTEWVGEGWDPAKFSVDEVNQRFRKMFSSSTEFSEEDQPLSTGQNR